MDHSCGLEREKDETQFSMDNKKRKKRGGRKKGKEGRKKDNVEWESNIGGRRIESRRAGRAADSSASRFDPTFTGSHVNTFVANCLDRRAMMKLDRDSFAQRRRRA